MAQSIVLEPHDVDFSAALPVISGAQKFIVPVAAFADGDPLVYPPGTEKAGKRITDWQGRRIGEEGIIFFNPIDKCFQAAAADGRSVIIINEVTSAQAAALEAFARAQGEPLEALSKGALERLLAYARDELGLADIYNSDDAFVRAKMTPVHAQSAAHDGARPHGLMKRDDRDICHAVLVPGPARFRGPAATPQHIPTAGAFILRQFVGGEPTYRMAACETLLRTYLHADGRRLRLRDFANGQPPFHG